jgi:hypothetical protein
MGMESRGPARASGGLVKMVGYSGTWSCGGGQVMVWEKIISGKRWETNVAFFSVLAVVKAYAHDDVGLGDRTEELFFLSY